MTDIKKSTAVDYLVRKEYVSGDKAIIDSGVLFSFDGSPIEIKELFNSGFCITIRFTFKTDQENKDNYNLKTNVDMNTNTVEFVCTNFNNSLGTGTKKPIELGMVDHRKIYIHFWGFALGGDKEITRKIEYSLFHER